MTNIIETIKQNISDDVVLKKFYFVRPPENKIYCMMCDKTYKKEKSMIDHLIKEHNILSSDEFKQQKNIMIDQEIQEHFALCNNFLTYDNIKELRKRKFEAVERWKKDLSQYHWLTQEEFDLCYSKAFKEGHSSGYDEIANRMYNIVGFMEKCRKLFS